MNEARLAVAAILRAASQRGAAIVDEAMVGSGDGILRKVRSRRGLLMLLRGSRVGLDGMERRRGSRNG